MRSIPIPSSLRSALLVGCALLSAASCAGVQSRDLPSDRFHFVDVNVLPVDGRRVIPNGMVTVADGRIAYVGPLDRERIGTGDEVVEAHGGWLLPGLFEMHAHLPPVEDTTWPVDDILRLFLAHGVTTVRGMLGHPSHLDLKDALASGSRVGPRLVTSGPSVNGNTAPDPETGARLVREQAVAGYDFVKIHPGLSLETFRAIAATAHQAGIPFAGHVPVAVGVENALGLGMATVDHLDGYAQVLLREDSPISATPPFFFGINFGGEFDDGRVEGWARFTAEAELTQVPTQSLFEHLLGEQSTEELLAAPAMRYVPGSVRAQWAQFREQLRDHPQAPPEKRADLLRIRRNLIRGMHQAGVQILVGADAPQVMNIPGLSTVQEIGFLVTAGMDPSAALRAATADAARFLGLDDTGRVELGAVADLLLVGANPLDDPGNLKDVLGVMRGGLWHDRATLDDWLEAIRIRAASDEAEAP